MILLPPLSTPFPYTTLFRSPAFQLVTVRQSYTNLPADPVARVFGIFFIPPLLARPFLASDRLHGFSRQRRLTHFNGGRVDIGNRRDLVVPRPAGLRAAFGANRDTRCPGGASNREY